MSTTLNGSSSTVHFYVKHQSTARSNGIVNSPRARRHNRVNTLFRLGKNVHFLFISFRIARINQECAVFFLQPEPNRHGYALLKKYCTKVPSPSAHTLEIFSSAHSLWKVVFSTRFGHNTCILISIMCISIKVIGNVHRKNIPKLAHLGLEIARRSSTQMWDNATFCDGLTRSKIQKIQQNPSKSSKTHQNPAENPLISCAIKVSINTRLKFWKIKNFLTMVQWDDDHRSSNFPFCVVSNFEFRSPPPRRTFR